MYHSFFIHLFADGHLGCFHILAIINSAAMNTGVHMSLSDLVSSVCMPRSGIAGSYGSSISIFFKESPHCSPVAVLVSFQGYSLSWMTCKTRSHTLYLLSPMSSHSPGLQKWTRELQSILSSKTKNLLESESMILRLYSFSNSFSENYRSWGTKLKSHWVWPYVHSASWLSHIWTIK